MVAHRSRVADPRRTAPRLRQHIGPDHQLRPEHDRRDRWIVRLGSNVYSESNAPQGWSADIIVLPIQALLGMRLAASLGGLLLVDPRLPSWLLDLRLKGNRVGRTRINLKAAWRTKSGEARYQITRREGRCAFSCSDLPKRRRLGSTAREPQSLPFCTRNLGEGSVA